MKENTQPAGLPPYVQRVTGELEQGYWQPQTLAEWAEVQRTTAFLSTWIKQQEQERGLRKMIGAWVFILITLQVAGVFALVTLDATKTLTLNTRIVQLLIPSVLAEVFGMGFIVVKYLFNPSATNPFDPRKRTTR